ncbi:MAG: alpha/beta hydrolase [Candidatus Lokiarchaeota archaeon]|nr:alpha/beta hydrolase [Candidatus Lokiarchaeota archaeon]
MIKIPYFEYSGKQIFYQIKDNNSQNTLVFIHGAGENSNIWENQFYLNIEYNIIAIDLPSHNKSNSFPELSLDLYVDVVKKLVDSLKPKNLILGGHSMGGVVIQEYYFRYPNDVSALILCSTGGRMRVSSVIFNSVKPNYQKYLDYLRVGSFYRKTSKKIIDDHILETSQIDPEVTYKDFKICDAFDTLDKTESIDIPCLIICGKVDQMTPVKYSQFFHEKIINSKLCIIEEAGHNVMLEKPKDIHQAIENFINNYLNNKK